MDPSSFSRTTSPTTNRTRRSRSLSDDIRTAIATPLDAADGKNVLVFGANVAKQRLDEGLIDEILIHLTPVLLGDRVRLFGAPSSRRIDLEPISVTRSGQLANLHYRVIK